MATVKEAPTRTRHDPTIEETIAANFGAYAGDTRTVERFGGNRWLKIAFGGGVITAGGWALYETVPAVHRTVDSAFLNHLRGSSEASTINSEEIFDPSATEEIISDKNTIEMILEEYAKIAPPTIDRKAPEKINIGLSIKNANGSDNIGKIIIKKRPDSIDGGIRTANFRIDPQTQQYMYDGQIPVNSNLIFKEGLEGKTVSLIIKDAKKVTIENMITEDTDILNRGGFHVNIESTNGDTATFIIGTTAIELTQHLPPARNENLGNGQWKLVSTPVPIESNGDITIVPLGKITTSSKANFWGEVLAEMSIISVSTVTDENGIKQVGPAEIMFNTKDGKFINPRANQ